jgi:hypothetical protein
VSGVADHLPPFLRQEGALLVPEATAAAPWAENMLHGRMLTALAARAVERDHADDPFRCVRLTIDLFRAATLDPVRVLTRPVREGGRIRVIEVEIESGGRAVARATALLLRTGEPPPVRPWQAPEWGAQAPEALAPEDTPESRFIPIETRSVVPGGYRAPGRKRVWLRELCPLVEGEEWTPLTRVAAVADLTNALANSDEQPNHFINADVTLYVGRLPEGEWIGLDTSGHVSAEGVATGGCDLYDGRGRCGTATVAALVAPAPLSLPSRP